MADVFHDPGIAKGGIRTKKRVESYLRCDAFPVSDSCSPIVDGHHQSETDHSVRVPTARFVRAFEASGNSRSCSGSLPVRKPASEPVTSGLEIMGVEAVSHGRKRACQHTARTTH